MLVLSRKQEQQIKIGDNITVTVLKLKGNTVKIGIQAPRDLRVLRGELPKLDDGHATIISISDAMVSGPVAEDTESGTDSGQHSESNELDQVTASPLIAHLPLRRIRNRHGRGPLTKLMAACALAK